MRLLIQRVEHATVIIGEKQHASIGKGLLVFLGISVDDNSEDIDYLCSKLVSLRIFPDHENKMNLDIIQTHGEILVVSQFTLFASTKKGNRPSFLASAAPDIAIPLYENFLAKCGQLLPGKIQSGVFGANMNIELLNAGPVTLMIDSRNKE